MSNKVIQPLSSDVPSDDNPAVALIRAKVARAYSTEPNAVEELAEIKQRKMLSQHQVYVQTLAASGKSLAEIQTEWHHYYTTLTDAEKREVWQEFYDANQNTPYQKLFQQQQPAGSYQPAAPSYTPQSPATSQPPLHPQSSANGVVVADHTPVEELPAKKPSGPKVDKTAARTLKTKVANKVSANGKLSAKHHLQSLGFGLASGLVVLVVLLFTFFNEYIIAPFIQPSRNVSSTPIILSNNTVSADAPPSVTVPKINIQIPLNFNVASFDESDVQDGLKSGVIHYPSTVMPGQNGNAAYFGHSSGNIFNNGKYKFAFTLLHDLTTGDLFYITYGGKNYAYRVFAREVVPPTQVSVINDTKGKQATATLITCDPPGISTNRLVVWGEQISPDINANTASAPTTTASTPSTITSNGPTLFARLVDTLEFWK